MFRRSLLYSSDDSDEEHVPQRNFQERIHFQDLSHLQFKENFRLTATQADYVLDRIGLILRHQTKRNHALSPKEQLLLSLHWMGNGAQMHGIGNMHGVSKSTVCRILHKVVDAIVDTMLNDIVRWPVDCRDLAAKFFVKGGFPSVCGCVDGTLIKMDAPIVNEAAYVDRHGNHSLNVMMVCGPDYKVYAVNANWPGSVHDSRVFRNTSVFRVFEQGWRPFPGAIILGDSAYKMSEWVITPLNRHPDDQVEQRFNRAHKSTRRIIENTFGIMKEKFPCLNYMRLEPEKVAKIVLACTILHNIARTVNRQEEDEPLVPNNDQEEEQEDDLEQEEQNDVQENGQRVNQLLNYFTH